MLYQASNIPISCNHGGRMHYRAMIKRRQLKQEEEDRLLDAGEARQAVNVPPRVFDNLGKGAASRV